jgi:sugar phosphate isomerase/epimerase
MLSRRNLILSAPLLALTRLSGAARNTVACQVNAWFGMGGKKDVPFPELLARVGDLKRLGYEAFECNIRFVQDQFPNAREARALIQKTGVRFYGTHVGLRFNMEELEGWVKGAASIGAERFALSGSGSVLAKDKQHLDPEAMRTKAESLNRLGAACKKAGLRLVYHNHGNEFMLNGAEIEELLKQTDPGLVWLLLDLGHAYHEHADVVAFMSRHHERIDALHLRDIKDKKQVPLGQGELDWSGLAAVIRKTGWPGVLTLEEENLQSDDDRFIQSVLKADREMIRRTFGV